MFNRFLRRAMVPTPLSAIPAVPAASDPIEMSSGFGFAETVERVGAAVTAAGLTVFQRIDHQAAARAVGLAMPPTLVLLYGNPKAGTPLMLAAPLIALDLPLRVLIREDAAGQTYLAFHPALQTVRAAHLPDSAAQKLQAAQNALVSAITR